MSIATMADAKAVFSSEGYLTNIEIMSPEAMTPYREEFDRLEAAAGKQASQVGLTNLHKQNPRIWELVSHPRVLAAVSEILGPNLLLLGSHFFCKYPDIAESYVSWHQDVTYWGLIPPKAVTLWLSIDGADITNGCMRFIPRSHHRGLLPHGNAKAKGNLLSVNQEIPSNLIDDSQAYNIELPPGSASLHHGMLIHGSNSNRSSRRRCGLTMRFTSIDVKPVTDDPAAVQWKPLLIQGIDRFGHFSLESWPEFARDGRQQVQPLVRSYQDAEQYEQEEPGKALFRWILKKDEIPGLQMGLVELKGPMHKTPATHIEFHQAYLIQSGRGTIHLGNEQRRVDGPTIVVIPKGVRHSVELAAGEELQYVYVNQHRI